MLMCFIIKCYFLWLNMEITVFQLRQSCCTSSCEWRQQSGTQEFRSSWEGPCKGNRTEDWPLWGTHTNHMRVIHCRAWTSIINLLVNAAPVVDCRLLVLLLCLSLTILTSGVEAVSFLTHMYSVFVSTWKPHRVWKSNCWYEGAQQTHTDFSALCCLWECLL